MADTAQATVLASLRGVSQDHVRTGKPLNLSLSIPGVGDVFCSKVFRAIRGKRLVCLGNVRGTKVIVKLYFARRRAYRHWRRSENGCRAFLERGIPAPGIIFSGYLPAYDLYAMVLEYLDGGTRVDRALEAMNDERKRMELLGRLVRELARHHAAGILQNDLHLGNFMVRDQHLYSLDGDQVKRCRKIPDRKRSLGNLARLLANLPPGRDEDLDACIRTYVHERHWSFSTAEESALKETVYRSRKKGLSRYLEKSLRSRDPFVARSAPGLFTVYDKRHTDVCLMDIISAAGRSTKAQGDLGMYGFMVQSCGKHDLLKLSFLAVGPLMFKRLFGAVRYWKNALMLSRIRLQTPEPVALVFRRKVPFLWECSVFFRPVKGIGLRDFFFSSGIAQEDRDRVSAGLTNAFARMSRVGISPGRLMPDHVLISGDELIFMNPGVFRRPFVFFRARYARALKRFLSHCGDMVTQGKDHSEPG